MKHRLLALCALLLVAVAAAACTGEGTPRERPSIIDRIPWTADESARYQLTDQKGEPRGEGVISIRRQDGALVIVQEFSDDEGNSDSLALSVEPDTLLPRTGRRTVVDKERRSVVEKQYEDAADGDYTVCIRQQRFDPPESQEPGNTRSNPLRVARSAYDNDASLALWRTIKFEQGYTVTYDAVIANRRDVRPVTLRVRRREMVRTPAGEFDSWLVGIEAEGQVHNAWFATTDDHKLLVYNNDDLVFLYAGEADAPDVPQQERISPSPCA